jgi:chromate transporter
MDQNPTSVQFKEALKFWFKLGFISFGGPAGQIATVHQELVEKQHWISEKRFLHALNYCMLLPGPEALQLVIYMGWLLHRTIGGVIAGLLFILPALLLLIVLSIIYMSFGSTLLVSGIFLGIKPAVTAIVIHAGYKIGKRILKTPFQFVIALCALFSIFIGLPYPMIIFAAGLLGWLASRYAPSWLLVSSTQHGSKNQSDDFDAIINDSSSQLPHTKFNQLRFLKILIVSLILWALPLAILIQIWGFNGIYPQLAIFFSKAALLTFGGAYAVLPYVFQSAVEQFQWLSATQMMDGLALGETTPGPLIIVVAFVGYIAAFLNTVFVESPILSGALGAVIVSWFIFLPSFCFIFLGGPFIESSRHEFKLAPVLTGISCAVTGVITSLSLFFMYHTIFPKGMGANFSLLQSGFSVTLIVLSTIALLRWQLSIIQLLLASAVIGLLWQWCILGI